MLWLNEDKIFQLASDLGMPPAYIEKDLHLIKVLQLVKSLDTDKHQLIFTGGTSLSKGHKIIGRFSEDIDFNINGASKMTRGERSKLRDSLISVVSNNGYTIGELVKANESRFFSVEIAYPKIFDTPTQLRQNLQLEVAYNEPRLKPTLRSVESFFYQYDNSAPATDFLCLSLTEIAANKINALLWRTNSQKAVEDPALMRHLYDLHALKPHIMNEDLKKLTIETFETDKTRADSVLTLNAALSATVQRLELDAHHTKSYALFVDRMVYDDSKAPFNIALNSFKDLAKFVEE